MTTALVSMTPETIVEEKARTIEYIYQGLDAISAEPLAETRVEIARNVNDAIQYLNQIADSAVAVMGATNETVRELTEQRDAAQEALEELTTALNNLDTEHPIVAEAVELIEEDLMEEFDMQMWDVRQDAIAEVKDEMYEAACENEYQEAIDHIRHIFHVGAMAASHFADLVLHGNTTNIAPDRLEALGELIERLHE